jgi:hypothetical protein
VKRTVIVTFIMLSYLGWWSDANSNCWNNGGIGLLGTSQVTKHEMYVVPNEEGTKGTKSMTLKKCH